MALTIGVVGEAVVGGGSMYLLFFTLTMIGGAEL